MKTTFKTRFGKEVTFERKEKKLVQQAGESFIEACVRVYYPVKYRELQKVKARPANV